MGRGPDGGRLTPVRVTPEDFHYAARNVLRDSHTIGQVGQDLARQLADAAGIAGVDDDAKQFDARYRPAADEVLTAFDRAVNLLGDVALGLDWSGINHWRADHACVPGSNPDEMPWSLVASGIYLPMNLTASSLVGRPKFATGIASLDATIPFGSPSGLHALAGDYATARDQVQDLVDNCRQQVESLFASNSSQDLDAFYEYWDRIAGNGSGAILTALIHGLDGLSQSLHEYARWMTDAMDEILRQVGELAVQAGFAVLFATASLFTGQEEGLPVAIGKIIDAVGVARAASAIDIAITTAGIAQLAAVATGMQAINTALSMAISATPNPNLDPTTPTSITDTNIEQATENRGDQAAPREIPDLNYPPKQLQKKFKHAADFGISGNWNSQAAGTFQDVLQRFAHDPTNVMKSGTYHGEPATLIYNTGSNLCEVLRPDGTFWTAFRLGDEQLKNVIEGGSLGGG